MDFATELALPPTDRLTDDQLRGLLAAHVRRLLRDERDWFLSKLYRLDVRERDIKEALATGEDASAELAGLILARHRERVAARKKYKPVEEPSDPTLGDMAW